MTATKTNFVELILSCASWQEAQRVADHLLGQRLIGAVEFVPVKAKLWETGLVSNGEIKLIMETATEYFDKIEAEVAKLRGYESAVLQSAPITKLSNQATSWLKGEYYVND